MSADVLPTDVPAALTDHRVVSREQWLKERIEVLKQEKALMRERDAMTAKVRALPWVKIDKRYTFDTVDGQRTLAELFGKHSQLVVYHFMFDPTWSQGCKSCSFIADHYDGILVHLAHRDISFVTVSKASMPQIEAFRERMGWSFPWVSASHNDFGRDMGVSFTDAELMDDKTIYNFTTKPYPIRELPGLSIFYKNEKGEIFHTYSVFARGLDDFLTAYRFIDLTPKGRDERQTGGMGWLRHHDRYGETASGNPWEEKPGITAPATPG